MPSARPASRPIALTMGDPAGIGPEIIAMLYRDHPGEMAGTVVYGDLACMDRAARLLGAPLPQAVAAPAPALLAQVAAAGRMPLRACSAIEPVAYGVIARSAGQAAASAVVQAAQDALNGHLAALVTAPLHKEALALAGVDHPGHTELLQAEAARHAGVPVDQMPVRMMLANPELRVVLDSIHVPLQQALDALNTRELMQTIAIAHASLSALLGRAPRLAVAGLNPHAGEGGRFGREDLDLVAPAVQAAQREGIDASGPWPPDTVFMRARRGVFDAVVALYHDQGLIPVKYLGVDDGVNVTLGLPLVRTSPDHGTAFDIAGRGQASAASLLTALQMARRLLGAAG